MANSFPQDCLQHVLGFLDIPDINPTCRVSRHWNEVFCADDTWRSLALGSTVAFAPATNNGDESYYDGVKRRHTLHGKWKRGAVGTWKCTTMRGHKTYVEDIQQGTKHNVVVSLDADGCALLFDVNNNNPPTGVVLCDDAVAMLLLDFSPQAPPLCYFSSLSRGLVRCDIQTNSCVAMNDSSSPPTILAQYGHNSDNSHIVLAWDCTMNTLSLLDTRARDPRVANWGFPVDASLKLSGVNGSAGVVCVGPSAAMFLDPRATSAPVQTVGLVNATCADVEIERRGGNIIVGDAEGSVLHIKDAFLKQLRRDDLPVQYRSPEPRAGESITCVRAASDASGYTAAGTSTGRIVVFHERNGFVATAYSATQLRGAVNDIWLDGFRVVSGCADGGVRIATPSGQTRYSFPSGTMSNINSTDDPPHPTRPCVSHVLCTDNRVLIARNSLLRMYNFN
eukprot:PhM_4_TR2863/c0_g1_i1/m.42376